MTGPTFDADGYPTQETLLALGNWPAKHANEALDFMAKAWHWPQFATRKLSRSERTLVRGVFSNRKLKCLRLATGGWSGNEDLIEAFSRSAAHLRTWRLSAVGGLHIYEYCQGE